MRWKEESNRPIDSLPPWLHAKDIIVSGYKEGFINWISFDKAMQKITTNKNGSWMFEQKQESLKEVIYEMERRE
jgi:hypothetical protein